MIYQNKPQGVAHLAKELEDLFNQEPLENNGKVIAHKFSACTLNSLFTSDALFDLQLC